MKWKSGATERTLCFDNSDGTLASIEYAKDPRQTPDITRIEYAAFKTVAGKHVPFEIRALKDRQVVAAVNFTEIAPAAPDPALFKAPVNSEFWTQCDDMHPQVANQVMPKYPAGALAHHKQGRVIIYAVIETDGSLSHMAVIEGVSPELDAAVLEAVRQWHYKPAVCKQEPIRMQTSIPVDFWVQE